MAGLSELQAYLQTLSDNPPGDSHGILWSMDLRPVDGGTQIIAVQEPGKDDPTQYSLWLLNGQPVLLDSDQAEAAFQKMAIPHIDAVTKGGGHYTGEKVWIKEGAEDKPIPADDIVQVFYNPENGKIIDPQDIKTRDIAKRGEEPKFERYGPDDIKVDVAYVSQKSIEDGVVSPEDISPLLAQGYVLKEEYINSMNDPETEAKYQQAVEFGNAVTIREGTKYTVYEISPDDLSKAGLNIHRVEAEAPTVTPVEPDPVPEPAQKTEPAPSKPEPEKPAAAEPADPMAAITAMLAKAREEEAAARAQYETEKSKPAGESSIPTTAPNAEVEVDPREQLMSLDPASRGFALVEMMNKHYGGSSEPFPADLIDEAVGADTPASMILHDMDEQLKISPGDHDNIVTEANRCIGLALGPKLPAFDQALVDDCGVNPEALKP